MLKVILNGLAEDADLTPKDGSYYYKKHSEHAGFSEVVAKAQAEEKLALLTGGEIEEARVGEAEVERVMLEEEKQAEAEAEERARGRAMTVG